MYEFGNSVIVHRRKYSRCVTVKMPLSHFSIAISDCNPGILGSRPFLPIPNPGIGGVFGGVPIPGLRDYKIS